MRNSKASAAPKARQAIAAPNGFQRATISDARGHRQVVEPRQRGGRRFAVSSCGGASICDFLPRGHRIRTKRSIRLGCYTVTGKVRQVCDWIVDRDETLEMPGRFEPL